jgi:hypothetical protein
MKYKAIVWELLRQGTDRLQRRRPRSVKLSREVGGLRQKHVSNFALFFFVNVPLGSPVGYAPTVPRPFSVVHHFRRRWFNLLEGQTFGLQVCGEFGRAILNPKFIVTPVWHLLSLARVNVFGELHKGIRKVFNQIVKFLIRVGHRVAGIDVSFNRLPYLQLLLVGKDVIVFAIFVG